MQLALGSRLGPYEVITPPGAGGIGEVYRARGSKLERDVALKILTEAFAEDIERMTRFERRSRAAAPQRYDYLVAVERSVCSCELLVNHCHARRASSGQTSASSKCGMKPARTGSSLKYPTEIWSVRIPTASPFRSNGRVTELRSGKLVAERAF